MTSSNKNDGNNNNKDNDEWISNFKQTIKPIGEVIAKSPIIKEDEPLRLALKTPTELLSLHIEHLYIITKGNRELILSNTKIIDRAISLLEDLSAKVNKDMSEEIKSMRKELEQEKENVNEKLKPYYDMLKESEECQERGSDVYG
jgi:hypothetical protein